MVSFESLLPETAVLRIDLNGEWSVQEFIRLLEALNEAYARLNAAEFFSSAVQQEPRRGGAVTEDWEEQHYFSEVFKQSLGYESLSYRQAPSERGVEEPEDLEVLFARAGTELVTIATQYLGNLHIKSIQFESPGWLEVIGSWNPLKVIADAVGRWREENTKRDQQKLEAQIKAMQIDAEVKKEVLKTMLPLLKAASPQQVERFAKYVVSGTQNVVGVLVKDLRVEKVMHSPTQRAA